MVGEGSEEHRGSSQGQGFRHFPAGSRPADSRAHAFVRTRWGEEPQPRAARESGGRSPYSPPFPSPPLRWSRPVMCVGSPAGIPYSLGCARVSLGSLCLCVYL